MPADNLQLILGGFGQAAQGLSEYDARQRAEAELSRKIDPSAAAFLRQALGSSHGQALVQQSLQQDIPLWQSGQKTPQDTAAEIQQRLSGGGQGPQGLAPSEPPPSPQPSPELQLPQGFSPGIVPGMGPPGTQEVGPMGRPAMRPPPPPPPQPRPPPRPPAPQVQVASGRQPVAPPQAQGGGSAPEFDYSQLTGRGVRDIAALAPLLNYSARVQQLEQQATLAERRNAARLDELARKAAAKKELTAEEHDFLREQSQTAESGKMARAVLGASEAMRRTQVTQGAETARTEKGIASREKIASTSLDFRRNMTAAMQDFRSKVQNAKDNKEARDLAMRMAGQWLTVAGNKEKSLLSKSDTTELENLAMKLQRLASSNSTNLRPEIESLLQEHESRFGGAGGLSEEELNKLTKEE